MRLTELGEMLGEVPKCPGRRHCGAFGGTVYDHCGARMVLRKSRTGELFWGCQRWPECSATYPFDFYPWMFKPLATKWRATVSAFRSVGPACPRPSSPK